MDERKNKQAVVTRKKKVIHELSKAVFARLTMTVTTTVLYTLENIETTTMLTGLMCMNV